MITYVKAGNDVFISANYFGAIFEKNLKITTRTNFQLAQTGTAVNFVNPNLQPKKQYRIDHSVGGTYFNTYDTIKAIVIGENDKRRTNFIKYKFGKGQLFLACNPEFFSNYSLLKPDGAEYAATVLSHLKSTTKIIWDIYYTQGTGGDNSPLRVFLNNPILQWAYYIAIFGLLIFVIFEVKRTQRIIPVIEPLSNSTLEFVTVVGQVYYEQRNNANIAQKKILYLLVYLRDEYQLRTNVFDEEFIDKLSAKLDVEKAFAVELISYINYINNQEKVTDRELIELDKMIEKLYIKSRYYGR